MQKILTRPELASQAQAWRAAGKKVVFTNGCYDILHAGHVQLLQAAKACGDILVLGLNADASVRRLKGEARPVNGEQARAFVLAALFLRDYPAEVNLPVYGQKALTPPPARSKKLIELLTTPLLTLREAAKTRVFWVLFATFYVCGFSTNGLIQQHWISICGDVGIAPTGAAGYLALLGAFDFVGTICSGWLSDRYDNRYLLLGYYGLRGLSLIYLPYSGFSLLTLTIFAVFYGLDWVATVPPTVKLTAQRFGAEKAGLVFGWVFAGHQLGAATAAFTAGAVRTGTSSYYPAILMAGILCLVAALLILSISRKPSAPKVVQAA